MEDSRLSAFSYRRIWQIALPILISTLIEQLIGMTDTAFLGRVSEVALGASALAGVYYMVLFTLGLGFSLSSGAGTARDALRRRAGCFGTDSIFFSPLDWQ